MNKILKTLIITWTSIVVAKYLKKNIKIKSNINLKDWKILIRFIKKSTKNIFPNINKYFKETTKNKNPFVSDKWEIK